jgi:hypothetical protein
MDRAVTDDCMDAGGRATQGAVAEGLGEIFNKFPSIPFMLCGYFFKGEVIGSDILNNHEEASGIHKIRLS